MSSLSIFPTEILECITSVVTTSQQVRLWQCGDRILNIKLKNGGLKRTSLCWTCTSWMPWPRWYFTTFDGIQDVEWCMGIGTSLCPTLELNLLPKTLKRLHLACDDVFILLSQQNVNMNDMLPLLHSLYLSGSRLCEKNLKNLPSNLIELCVASWQGCIKSSSLFRDLPRTVERLTLSFWIVDESEHENDLPSDLVSCTTFVLEANFNWFGKLPKSLKYLEMAEFYFPPDWFTLPQLEILKLWKCPKSALPQLPQSLKSLELGGIEDCTFDSPDEFVSLLPKNLTELKLANPLLMRVPSSELQKLPVSLTSFEFGISTDRPDVISLFHPQTSIIRLGRGSCSQSLNFLPFPTKLQSLDIWHINDDICAMLPTGLQSLKIDAEGLITSKGSSKLPKSLTSFTAPFQVFDNTETMKCLAFVKILDLRAKNRSNDFEDWMSSLLPSSIPTCNKHNDSTGLAYIQGDNYHLTSLIVDEREETIPSPYLTKSFFLSLSKFKSLATLKIWSSGGTPSDWLCLIPQQVTELNISSLSTFPTVSQLSKLPTCLKYLNLSVEDNCLPCNWTDETLQSLPRLLQKFVINGPFPNLTERRHEYLPHCLHQSNLLIVTPLDRLYYGKK